MQALLYLLAAAVATANPMPSDNLIATKRQSGGGFIQFGSKCSQTVYYEVFENKGPHSTGSKLTSGALYPQTGFMSAEVNYGEQSLGISIKTSFNENPSESGPLLQFEVDQDQVHDLINYDISAVNGNPNPFQPYGFSMYVDETNGPCYNIECPPGNEDCAFLYPNDNSKDHSCPGTDHIVYAQVCDDV